MQPRQKFTARRLLWACLALIVASLAVAGVPLAVERLTREPPNYSRIEDGLYLGGYVDVPPPGTRAVLNLCETEDEYHSEIHRWEPIRDAEPAPSLQWLREQVEFIDRHRRDGRGVFVHCRNGVSRSGMVVVAYVMFRQGRSRDEALTFVRNRRDLVRPNLAFMGLLLEWERLLSLQ